MRPLLPLLAVPPGLALALALPPSPLRPDVGAVPLLAAHLGVAFLSWALWRRASTPLVALRALTFGLCFPVIGPLAAWLVHPSRPVSDGGLLARYRELIARPEGKPHAEAFSDADEALRQELSVLPLVDALNHGDLFTKQAAIAALSQGKEGAGILRSTLTHSDGDTRLFGSLALLKLEEGFLDALTEARDAAEASEAHGDWRNLQDALLRYLDSGLPDGEVALGLWRELRDAARRERDLGGDESLTRSREAQASCELGDLAAARDAASWLQEHPPEDEEALLRLSRALFALGELDRLSTVAERLAAVATPSSPAHQAASFWRGDDAR
ncbi:hypothetical protein D3C87_979950 [compost metagenome]